MVPRVQAAILCLCSLGAAEIARGQPYPNKPIRVIVPFSAGGGTDIVTRAVAAKMSEALGQAMPVENRVGANGNIAHETTARAAPDGYTILMASSALTINPSVYRKLAYDPVKDFTPISLVTLIPFVLVVHPSVPARSVKELIALGHARPGSLVFASSGVGNATHLSMELFRTMAGIDMLHVPYKGTGQALTDIVGGQVHTLFGSIPSTMPHARAKRLRALAVSSAKRSPAIADIPTVAEAGLPGYELASWYGLLAPAATPVDVVTRLHAEAAKAVNHAEVRARLAAEGADPVASSPDQFASRIRSDIGKYAKVVAAAKVAPE